MLLTQLMEEACEVAHIASKCIRFGMMDRRGDGHPTNHFILSKELTDLKAIVRMLEGDGSLRLPAPGEGERGNTIQYAIEVKKAKVEQYLLRSIANGQMEVPEFKPEEMDEVYVEYPETY
jgi:hypothetical protein